MSVLALDIGTSSVRARVYDETGIHVRGADAQTRYDVMHGRGGRAELDPDHIVEAARAALDSARAGEAVDAVATSCFWHSLLAVDRRGLPISPLLIWQDTRSAAQAEELSRRLDPAAVHARTGCVLHPSFWPAKLAWLAEERADLFRSADRFLSFADYLYLRLVGEARTSLSMASGTGLLDLNQRRWDEELLDVLALGPERLPEISDEPAGEDEPWFPALGDGACSNVGAGCLTRERAALMIGTSGAYRTVFAADRAQAHPGLFLYRLDGERFVEGGSVSDGGNLYAWLGKTLTLEPGFDLSARPPDGHGLTFLPLLGGERSPGWNGDARGAVSGLTFDTTPADLLQAALEGVAYRFAEIADLMPEVETVVATGHALLENLDWAQVIADVLGRAVTASAVPEGSARGAAAVALERLGLPPAEAPLARTLEPRPDRSETYRAARERQRLLYDAVT